MASATPSGEAAIGTQVARDFGEKHGGIFYGRVVSVKGKKTKLYLVKYSDGDQEDLDEEQFSYAVSLAIAQKQVAERSDSSCDENSDSSFDATVHTAKRTPSATAAKAAAAKATPPSVAKATPSIAAFGGKPNWQNVSRGGLRFKPVLTRETMRKEETKPRFRSPCRETGSLEPLTFTMAFFPDEMVQMIAVNSEKYRRTKAVIHYHHL